MSFEWNDENIATLTKLWNDGFSASAINDRMGVGSRSAVIGKVFRLGLPGRRTRVASRLQRQPRTKFNYATNATKAKPKPTVAPEPYVARETIVTPEHERLSFEALVDGRCKYAHGDQLPYSFCGAKAVAPGVSWCPTHFQVVTGAPHPTQRVESQAVTDRHELEAVS